MKHKQKYKTRGDEIVTIVEEIILDNPKRVIVRLVKEEKGAAATYSVRDRDSLKPIEE